MRLALHRSGNEYVHLGSPVKLNTPSVALTVDVTGRVAHAIMDLCNEPDAMTHPDGMQIKVSRQELSRLVGCSREMAGRVLKILEEQGLVSASGKTIVVYNARPKQVVSLSATS